jgi:DNA polymerase III epsilon subunit-like protein
MESHKICFLYTHTNGFHETNEPVSKKNMFEFARLIQLKYSIGFYKDDKYNEEKKEKYTLLPKSINFNDKAVSVHKIDFNKAKKKGQDNVYIINKFKEDLKGVKIIVGHNLHFHLRTIQVELFRSCVNIDFNHFILIDLMDFNRDSNISLVNLAKKYNIDSEKYTDIKLFKKLFIPVYKDYIKKNSE